MFTFIVTSFKVATHLGIQGEDIDEKGKGQSGKFIKKTQNKAKMKLFCKWLGIC